ncbi:MAG: hypothetical protein WA061_04600 [Microgenomates group bacterium]
MKFKLLLLLALALLLIPRSVEAGCTFSVNGDANTMVSSCSFDNDIDGIDEGADASSTTNTGELRIAGGTLTITATQQISLGKLTLTGGSLAIIDGGKLAIGKTLWYIDADQDSYVTSLTPQLLAAKPVGGIRKAFLTPLGVDCNDNDGGAAGAGPQHVFRTSPQQCYTDADGDTYTNGPEANSSCINAATCAAATKASASSHGALMATYTAGRLRDAATATDCGDGNANAHPGQALYYSTSFTNTVTGLAYDWNCSGAQDKDPSQPTYVCNTTGCASHVFTISNGFAAATACGATGTWNTYAGAVAGTCTTTIGGAGTTCPAVTTTSVAQKCH